MAMTLVNLTLLKLNEELEIFLTNYPDLINRTMLKDPAFRPTLIAYVLSHIPNRYVALEVEKVATFYSKLPPASTQEQLDIEKSIYQGIYNLSNQFSKPDFQPN